jgi:hypothetical protein
MVVRALHARHFRKAGAYDLNTCLDRLFRSYLALHRQFDFGKLAADWGRPFGQGAALFKIKAPHRTEE